MKRGAEKSKKNPTNQKSSKELDQYFTKPDVALKCIELLDDLLSGSISDFNTILEPSYGDGAFVSGLRKKGIKEPKLYYIDIDTQEEGHRGDFLSNSLNVSTARPFLTIGNPPFGKNSSLAIEFFNTAAKMSDVIAFILSRTFRKNSCINRLDQNFFLCFEQNLDKHSFLFEGTSYDVPCVFQVWTHSKFAISFCNPPNIPSDKLRVIVKKLNKTTHFEFVSCEDNLDFAIRRVGVNAGRIFTESVVSRSKESHLFVRVLRREQKEMVLERLKQLNMERLESKYDTAGNPSISKDEICRLYQK